MNMNLPESNRSLPNQYVLSDFFVMCFSPQMIHLIDSNITFFHVTSILCVYVHSFDVIKYVIFES